MTRRRFSGDRGQAFPLYAVVVVGVLFAALAYFTISKAGIVRSGAQGAADAAALAAARDARDNLVSGLDLAALSTDDWERVLQGSRFEGGSGPCEAATDFAARNDATGACSRAGLQFTVRTKTNAAVGDSVVPGVSGKQGTAVATAEIVPRCRIKSTEPGGGDGSTTDPSPTPTSTTAPSPPGRIEFRCDKGAVVVYDPARPISWRSLAAALFDIRLIA
ncbi:pilus assembly protein TadG-related protein [Streptomyces sp. NPDC053429]|uniref:pilus assembly protein TadG-related protein n=1 Tax=Streptomyces sp. NPDC053429 TaxID=3365702 RepID=UPI0037D424F9